MNMPQVPMSPQAQWTLAMQMPLDRLTAILKGQPSEIDAATAMSAVIAKKKQKTAAQGMQAQQQLQQPNVKDQLLAEDQGIAAYPAPNMNAVVNAAHGGVVGYAGGGDVQHFFGAGQVRGSPMDAPTSRFEDIADYFRVLNQEGTDRNARRSALQEAQRVVQPKFREAVTPEQRRIREDAASYYRNLIDNPNAPYPGQAAPSPETPAASGYAGYAPAPGSQAASQPATGPKVKPATNPRVQGAPVPDPNFITQQDPEQRVDTNKMGIEAALPPAQQAQYERPDWLNTMNRFSGTDKISNEMTETLKQLTDTAEEKSSKKNIASGTTFLKAARAALQPGKTGSGALGDIFGELASGAEQYKKEESADKRAMLGAKMSMLGAQAQIMQGKEKSAADMFSHGETLALQASQYTYDRAFKQEELRIRDRQISDEDKYRMAQVAGEAAKNKTLSEWYEMHRPLINAEATYYGNKGTGGVTEAQYASTSARLSADITKQLDSPSGVRIRNSPEYKGKTDEFIRKDLLKKGLQTAFPNAGGAQEERSSFQRDDRRPGTPLAPELP